MIDALRLVSVERGLDPRDFTLVAFGGAGPLHAIALAEALGIRRVLIPPAPGNLSATGLVLADVRHDLVRTMVSAIATADSDRRMTALEDLGREQPLAPHARAVPSIAHTHLTTEERHPGKESESSITSQWC